MTKPADHPLKTAGVATLLEAGPLSQPLLRVLPGVPADAAYEQVSILLGYITHLIREGDAEDDHKLLGAADYLSTLAKALVNDLEIARNRRH